MNTLSIFLRGSRTTAVDISILVEYYTGVVLLPTETTD